VPNKATTDRESRSKVEPVSGAVATSPLSKKVTLSWLPLRKKSVVSGVPSASPLVNPGPRSLSTSSWLGKPVGSTSTVLRKPAASGSNQSPVELETPGSPETPTRAIDQKSAPLKVTGREVVPFKVAVSDVEENSVMTRGLDCGRTHWLRYECGHDCNC